MSNLDLQVGDRVTSRNDETGEIYVEIVYNEIGLENIKKNSYRIKPIKIERIGKNGWETIYEKPKEILDEVEKEYLWNIVKPFRNKVQYIIKNLSYNKTEQWITIFIDKNFMQLPYFPKNTMYKGMEENKEYTLEELGLVEECEK